LKACEQSYGSNACLTTNDVTCHFDKTYEIDKESQAPASPRTSK